MKRFLKNILLTLAGIAELCFFYFLIGNGIELAVDLIFSNRKAEPEPTRTDYTYEYQTEEPDPYWYDEYGFQYELVYGTTDEYCLDEEYTEELDTPDSSAFFSIGYHPYGKKLWVVFRNTGNAYYYYDVPYEVWHDFKNAESKGSYFQECIRDYYEYERD